jgi:hypothetical protein
VEVKMVRVRESILANRKLAFSGVLALALIAGVIVSLTSSPPRALADYYTGCTYGYGSSGSAGSFGSGSGIGYGYGYVGSHFAYGYGNEVCPMSVTTSSLAAGTAGTPYSQPLTATGGTGTYTWSETGGLDGLAFSSGGALTGTPSTSGTFPITFTATDGNGATTSASLSLSVAAAGGGGGGGTSGTTTTTVATTTTAPVTTTTGSSSPPPAKRFYAGKVRGFVVPGKAVLLTIPGAGFFGNPKVTSSEVGTRVQVLHDHGTSLIIRVIVPIGSKTGEYTLTFQFANGKVCKANYSVK